MKHSIIFLSAHPLGLPTLEKLHDEHNILAVITQPDRPVGRKQELTPGPIKVRAQELGLTVLQPEKASEIPTLINEQPDFLITAAYGQFLPDEVLDLPKYESLNIHPSLLPLYRGATPMQSALLNGDNKTGVSIMRMVAKMDAGAVFAQEEFELPPDMRYPELESKCASMGADMLLEVLANIESIKPKEQDHDQATHCSKVSKQDGQVNWSEDSAKNLYNKLRAFTPWPGVYTWWKEQKLSLLDFTAHPDIQHTEAGTVFESEGSTFIQCDEGAIKLREVQLAGKKPSSIKDFLNGHSEFQTAKLS